MAASWTVRAMGPACAVRLGEGLPKPPARGIRPVVGLIPYKPQKLLGFRMDPPPSVPVAKIADHHILYGET